MNCIPFSRDDLGAKGGRPWIRQQGLTPSGPRVAALLSAQVAAMAAAADFQDLEAGRATRERYDAFLDNVARAHLRSPQLVAFLYSIAPPAAAESVLHNLLEELGLEDKSDVAHPSLLRELIVGAGLGQRLPEIEWLANITNRKTRRAYKIDVGEFSRFAGLQRESFLGGQLGGNRAGGQECTEDGSEKHSD